MTVPILIAAACVLILLLDARRADRRQAAQLQGIELRADTSQRFDYRKALQAKGGGSW